MPKSRKSRKPIMDNLVANRLMQKAAEQIASRRPENAFAVAIVAFLHAQETLQTKSNPDVVKQYANLGFKDLHIGKSYDSSKPLNAAQQQEQDRDIEAQVDRALKVSKSLYNLLQQSDKNNIDTSLSVKSDVSALLSIATPGRSVKTSDLDDKWINQITEVYRKYEALRAENGGLGRVVDNFNQLTNANISLERTPTRSRSSSITDTAPAPEIQDILTDLIRNQPKNSPAQSKPTIEKTSPLAKGEKSDNFIAKAKRSLGMEDTTSANSAAPSAAELAAAQNERRRQALKGLNINFAKVAETKNVEQQTKLTEEKKERIENIVEEIKQGRSYLESGAGRPLTNIVGNGMVIGPTTINVRARIAEIEALKDPNTFTMTPLNKESFQFVHGDESKTFDASSPTIGVINAESSKEQFINIDDDDSDLQIGVVSGATPENPEIPISGQAADGPHIAVLSEEETATAGIQHAGSESDIEEEIVFDEDEDLKVANGVAPVSSEQFAQAQAAEAEQIAKVRQAGTSVFAAAAQAATAKAENAQMAEVRNKGTGIFAEAAQVAAQKNEQKAQAAEAAKVAAEAQAAEAAQTATVRNIGTGVFKQAAQLAADRNNKKTAEAEQIKNFFSPEADQNENNIEQDEIIDEVITAPNRQETTVENENIDEKAGHKFNDANENNEVINPNTLSSEQESPEQPGREDPNRMGDFFLGEGQNENDISENQEEQIDEVIIAPNHQKSQLENENIDDANENKEGIDLTEQPGGQDPNRMGDFFLGEGQDENDINKNQEEQIDEVIIAPNHQKSNLENENIDDANDNKEGIDLTAEQGGQDPNRMGDFFLGEGQDENDIGKKQEEQIDEEIEIASSANTSDKVNPPASKIEVEATKQESVAPSGTIVIPPLVITKAFAIALVNTTQAAVDKTAISRMQTLMESMRLKAVEFSTDNFQNLASRESLKQQWQGDLKTLRDKVAHNASRLLVAQEHLLECQGLLAQDKTTIGKAKDAEKLYPKVNEVVGIYEKMWDSLETMARGVEATKQMDYSERIRLTASKITVIQADGKDSASIHAEITKAAQTMVENLGSKTAYDVVIESQNNSNQSAKVNVKQEIAVMVIAGETGKSNLNANTVYTVGPTEKGNFAVNVISIRKDLDPAALMTRYIMDRPALKLNFPSIANETDDNKVSAKLMQMCSTIAGAPPSAKAVEEFLRAPQEGRQRLETTNGFVKMVAKQMATDLQASLCDPKKPGIPNNDAILMAQKLVEDYRNGINKQREDAQQEGRTPEPNQPMVIRGQNETVKMAVRLYCEAMQKLTKDNPEVQKQYAYIDRPVAVPVKKEVITSVLGYLNPVNLVKQYAENQKIPDTIKILQSQDNKKLGNTQFQDRVDIHNSYTQKESAKTTTNIQKAFTSLQKIDTKVQGVQNAQLEEAIQDKISSGPRGRGRTG